jgi:hypothetical protein
MRRRDAYRPSTKDGGRSNAGLVPRWPSAERHVPSRPASEETLARPGIGIPGGVANPMGPAASPRLRYLRTRRRPGPVLTEYGDHVDASASRARPAAMSKADDATTVTVRAPLIISQTVRSRASLANSST